MRARALTGIALVVLLVLGVAARSQGVAAADSTTFCEPQAVVTIATDPAAASGAADSPAVTLGCAAALSPPVQGAKAGGTAPGPSGTIATVAGGGIGDGGAALDAVFFLPSYAIFDSAGNLYVSTQQRVIKVSPAGIASTFAGTGTIGFQGDGTYYGDGGPATAATFGQSSPSGLAFDGRGNLYMADTGNRVVRKVDANGVITTIAGGGATSHYGIEGDDPRNVFLWAPDGLAVDTAGNLFIADSGNCTVRELKASDGKIYTFAGIPPVQSNPVTRLTCGYTADGVPALGSALYQPKDVKVDAAGNVYIADIGNNRIRKVDTAGLIHTVAGNGAAADSGDGGPAVAAGIANPWHIALTPSGELYIVEYFGHKVRRVDPSGIITTFAGNGVGGFSGDGGPAAEAELLFPLGVAVDAPGDVYVGDFGNNRLREVDAETGTIRTIAGNGQPPHVGNAYYGNGYAGDGLPARSAALSGPLGVAVDRSGIYIADTTNNRVRKVDASTGIIRTFAGNGQAGYSGDGGLATGAVVTSPMDVALDRKGQLYIANGLVRKVDAQGIITTVAGGGHPPSGIGDGGPATAASLIALGVFVDQGGNIYIADGGNQRIRRVNRQGVITTVAGNGTRGFAGDGGPATGAALDGPRAVALDGAGNLFIADAGNGRIRKVDTSGVITTVAGNGARGYDGDGGAATSTALNFPSDVAADAAGNLFISDTGNCFVREVDAATGRIRVIAGVPLAFKTTNPGFLNCDFNGDGGPGTGAHLFAPSGLALDTKGNLFFADTINSRIRVLYGVAAVRR